jgi:hypothetical protein
MGAPSPTRNKGRQQTAGTFRSNHSLYARNNPVEAIMADDREKISTGPNDRPLNETIAGTGPGIPDEALAPGEELPEPPSDEEVERAAKALGAPTAEKDTLPLEGE